MTLKKYEFDGLTGEGVLRDMTTEEVADHNSYVAKVEAYKEAQEKTQADKAALLAKLGITADEAKLLLS
jgi:hypothetical protein